MSVDSDSLGDRMKAYERVTQTVLPSRTWTIVRVDGRAFHTYMRGAGKPYDEAFMADMDAVGVALCEEISGSLFAYVQSDEVSVLAVDFQGANTQPWFGGEVQKIVSTSAAVATATLMGRRPGKVATFDSRVFTISGPIEVGNYFIWRQRDAVRNSIAMAAQAQFSHKRLHGVNTSQMQELLWSEKGINWSQYPDGCKRGRIVRKESGEREVTFEHKRTGEVQTVTAMRSWWVAEPAPHFSLHPDSWLASTIPTMPQRVAA